MHGATGRSRKRTWCKMGVIGAMSAQEPAIVLVASNGLRWKHAWMSQGNLEW